MALHRIDRPKTLSDAPRPLRPSFDALWSIGFRPFFLLAALFAVGSVLAWDLVLRGHLALISRLGATAWHAHEMLFGFTAAVLAGFLLTAVQNWTGRSTATGSGLFALATLWLLGRAATAWSGSLPPGLAEIVDVAFLPALAAVIARPIVQTRNRRNYGIPVLLLVLAAANAGLHLAVLGIAPALYRPSLAAALFVPLVFLVLIGGRVVPTFTGNALTEEGRTVRTRSLVDTLAVMAAVVTLLAETAASAWSSVSGLAAGADVVTGGLVLLRMRGWQSWATRRRPILWVLHLGYALLGVGYVAMGAAKVWPAVLPPSAALHVVTIGGLALLILGMTSRVSLGHTGRPLVVGRSVTVAYLLLAFAVVPRLVVPWVAPAAAPLALDAAALLFAAAFGIYVVVYLPILVTPRPTPRS